MTNSLVMRALVLVMVLSCVGSCAPLPVPPPPAGPRPAVQLLEPGEPPREVLRYKFQRGAVELEEVSVKVTATIFGPGHAVKANDTPTMEVKTRATVAEVLPDGDAHLAHVFEGATAHGDGNIPPAARNELTDMLSKLAGVRAWSRRSPRGDETELIFDEESIAPGAREIIDSMRRSSNDGSVLFPDEEVGIGAKWAVSTRAKIGNGMIVDRTITYTLTRRSGSTAEIDFTIQLSGEEQPLRSVPGAKLTSLKGAGRGQITIGLDRIVHPATAAFAANARFTVPDGLVRQLGMLKIKAASSVRAGRPAPP